MGACHVFNYAKCECLILKHSHKKTHTVCVESVSEAALLPVCVALYQRIKCPNLTTTTKRSSSAFPAYLCYNFTYIADVFRQIKRLIQKGEKPSLCCAVKVPDHRVNIGCQHFKAAKSRPVLSSVPPCTQDPDSAPWVMDWPTPLFHFHWGHC